MSNQAEDQKEAVEPTHPRTKVYLMVECEVEGDFQDFSHVDRARLTVEEALLDGSNKFEMNKEFTLDWYGDVFVMKPLVVTNACSLEMLEDGKGGVHLVGV